MIHSVDGLHEHDDDSIPSSLMRERKTAQKCAALETTRRYENTLAPEPALNQPINDLITFIIPSFRRLLTFNFDGTKRDSVAIP